MNPLQAQTDKLIFLSYSRANRDFARQFYTDLQALGFKLWRDLHEIDAGGDWWEQIKAAINACDTLVLCVSLPALRSPVVSDEWNYARQQGKRVIQVIADDVFKHPDVVSGAFTIPNWMTRANWVDFRAGTPERDLIWGRFIQTLNQPYEPRRVMVTRKASELPPNFVPRPNEMEPVVRALVNERNEAVAITAALKGAGGYGKTILAKAICRDLRVSGAFDDGIFWVTLGEEFLNMSRSDRENQLTVRLLDLSAQISGIRPAVSGFEAAQEELAQKIGDRYMLLVIDDVWHQSHLDPFLVRGKHNATLITTRNRDTIPADAFRQNLDAMDRDEAVTLLAACLDKNVVHSQSTELRALAKRLGDYPLLLGAVNGVLRKLTERQPLAAALVLINVEFDKRGLKAFDARNPQERSEAVTATLGVSIDHLTDDEQERYHALGIFREDVRIPLTTLMALWDDQEWSVRDFCERLYDASLIQDFDGESIALHDVVRRYLLEEILASITALHVRLVENWGDVYQLPDSFAWRWYIHHLCLAGKVDTAIQLLFDYGWLSTKLNRADMDVNALMTDCDELLITLTQDDEQKIIVRLLRSAFSLSANVLISHKEQLAVQLAGRLYVHRGKEGVASLLQSISPPYGSLWPVHLTATHQPAGGLLLRILQEHTHEVRGALELGDSRLLTWSKDYTLRLWDKNGQPLARLEGHTGPVRGALELSDGLLLSWSKDSMLRLWDKNGQPLARLEGHTGPVKGALELSDGLLLSWSKDSMLRLWDKNGRPLARLEGHTGPVKGALELSDGLLLSWSKDSMLRMWDKNGQPLARLEGHTGWVNGALELEDGRILSWSKDNTLRLWDKNGQPLARLEGHTGWVNGALELEDGRILSWSKHTPMRLWDKNGQPLARLEGHTDSVDGALELEDGRILSWSKDYTLRLWDKNGQPLARLSGHTGWVNGALELEDGWILSWARDRTLRLWDKDGQPLAHLEGHTGWVNGALELEDDHFLSWSSDNTLRLWDKDGQVLASLERHTYPVLGVLPLPDGRIFSWSEDHTLWLWDKDGQPLVLLEGNTGWVNGVLELDDGSFLSWAMDSTLRLWDKDGKPLAPVEGHTGWVNGALQLADGRILSLSGNSTLLWDQDWQLFTAFYGDAPITCCVVLEEQPLRVALGDSQGRVMFLKLIE